MLNVVLVLMLTTSILGPVLTQRFAPRLVEEHSANRTSSIVAADPLLILAFSGGGTRAAAFSHGVLEELRRTQVGVRSAAHSMLSEIDIVSSVSGGSFAALA